MAVKAFVKHFILDRIKLCERSSNPLPSVFPHDVPLIVESVIHMNRKIQEVKNLINTRRTLLALFIALTMITLPMLMVSPAMAQPGNGSLTTAIMQVIPGVGTFTGTLTTNSFTLANGVINAVGTLTGTFTNLAGVTTPISQAIVIPLTSFVGTCTILTLHTGAINLNVLGLAVSLSPIDLVITAIAAPGNLLGNLLCSVVHLLDSNGSLTLLTSLLNQILGAIRL